MSTEMSNVASMLTIQGFYVNIDIMLDIFVDIEKFGCQH